MGMPMVMAMIVSVAMVVRMAVRLGMGMCVHGRRVYSMRLRLTPHYQLSTRYWKL
jgi:hypothetical protein